MHGKQIDVRHPHTAGGQEHAQNQVGAVLAHAFLRAFLHQVDLLGGTKDAGAVGKGRVGGQAHLVESFLELLLAGEAAVAESFEGAADRVGEAFQGSIVEPIEGTRDKARFGIEDAHPVHLPHNGRFAGCLLAPPSRPGAGVRRPCPAGWSASR